MVHLVLLSVLVVLLPSDVGRASEAAFRFLTVPPSGVVEGRPVELRLSVGNHGPSTRAFSVDFYVDDFDEGRRITPDSVVLSVPPGAERLASTMWDPAGWAGDRTLLYRVRDGQSIAAEGSWPLAIESGDSPSRFGGVWVEPGHILFDRDVTETDVRDRVDEMHGLGMDTIIIAYVEFAWGGWGPFYPSEDPDLGEMRVSFDVIGTFLDQAERNGMHVFLGLGRGPDGPLDLDEPWVASDEEMDAEAERGERVAEELHELYGHHSSFYGWYISHEANSYGSAKYFYDEQARRLRRFGPEKPVMIAPAGTPTGISTASLNASEVDVFAYQDAVGPGYVGPDTSCITCLPYSYTWDPYLRIDDLEDIWTRYASWHEGTDKHIWGDVEIWQMDGPQYSDAYAPPCGRVRDQLEVARDHVGYLTAYEFLGYMRSPENQTRMPRAGADDLYEGYHAYVTGASDALCPVWEPPRCPVPLPYVPGEVRRQLCAPGG